MSIKYEKLRKICFNCGRTVHDDTGCASVHGSLKQSVSGEKQFGVCLTVVNEAKWRDAIQALSNGESNNNASLPKFDRNFGFR